MSNIVSSLILEDTIQGDSRWIVEKHVDKFDNSYHEEKTVPLDYDSEAGLAETAEILSNQLAQNEIDDNIYQILNYGSQAELNYNFSTESQNISAVVEMYSELTTTGTVMISDYLNTLSDEQLNVILGLSEYNIFQLRTAVNNINSNTNIAYEILGEIAAAWTA